MTEKSSDDERSLRGDADAADFRGTTGGSDDGQDDELERLLTDFYAD